MLGRIIDYALSMLLGALIGAGIGAFAGDVPGGAVIGLVVGFFIGVGVQAWRTQGTPSSFEDRDLGGWTDD